MQYFCTKKLKDCYCKSFPLPGKMIHFDKHFSKGFVKPPTVLLFWEPWKKGGYRIVTNKGCCPFSIFSDTFAAYWISISSQENTISISSLILDKFHSLPKTKSKLKGSSPKRHSSRANFLLVLDFSLQVVATICQNWWDSKIGWWFKPLLLKELWSSWSNLSKMVAGWTKPAVDAERKTYTSHSDRGLALHPPILTAPPQKKWCLKDDPFVFGFRPIFRGKLVVKFPGCTLHCTSSSTSPEQTTKPCGLLKDLWTSGLEGYRKPKSGLVEGLEELGGFLVQSGPRNDRYKWSSGFCSRIISSPKQGECLGQQSTWWFFGTHYFVGDDIDTSFEVFCRCWGMM